MQKCHLLVIRSDFSRFRTLVATLVLGMFCGILSPAWAQVIPNPSFETDAYPQWPGYNGGSNPATISGWVSSPLINAASPGINPISSVHASPSPFADNGAIPDGSQVAFIQSYEDSLATLSTTITGLTSGNTYTVSFRANMRAVTFAPSASWSLNGQALVPFTASPAVGGTNPYYLIEGSFVATGATAALHLQNQTPNSTLLVDDFKINASLIVTTLSDGSGGSLRSAIANASPGSIITFDPSLSGKTITLTGTELLIDKNLTIDASALPGGITIDANNASRVLYIRNGSVVTLDSLTITGGNADAGGGISVYQSSLTLQNSTITGNSAAWGGGLHSNANLSGHTTTLINCTLTNNSATGYGGGINNINGKMILTFCTITGNAAPVDRGGGVASNGNRDYFNSSETVVFATIISGNTNSDVDYVWGNINTFTSRGANLIGTGYGTNNFYRPKDQVGITNPQLAPLANYGGPTQTMPPLSASSPAVNTASTSTGSPSTDQRGFPRIYGSFPDIGAAEFKGFVTTLADSGVGSLRDKITNASPGDTITFDPPLSGQTINLGGTELLIDKDLTIDASALPGGITIDANNVSRVIRTTSGNVVTLDSLTITGGNSSSGGGILVYDSSLTLKNATLTGNTATYGGGLFTNTDLAGANTTLINCTVTNNSATSGWGGGIYNYEGKTILTHCTITGNTAPASRGSGVGSFGGSYTDTEVFATIISGNTNSDFDFETGGINSFTSTDANLIGTGNATGAFNQPKDQVGITNPQLAPLGDYGGPTQTMPPLSIFSPAVNAAITSAGSPSIDQRGLPRIYESIPDIGAVELQYSIPIVSTLADSGEGSLRDKIANATAGETLTFDPSLSGTTITLGGTPLTIDKDLTIDASTLPGGIIIDANNASRVITIVSGSVVTLDSLTVTGGNSTSGGGIHVSESSLTLQNSTLTGNTATFGGGLFTNTDLAGVTTTLINCTLTNNSATSAGGGIYNNNGNSVLTHCTITGNTAPAGFGSGVSSFGDSLTETEVFATIISSNTNSDVDFVGSSTNSFISNDANLIGTGNATGNFSELKDQIGITTPQLAPLGNYGGPTQTMPPLSPSSLVVNAAITIAGAPSTDQRGLPRIYESIPDIGAVEIQYIIPVVTTLADNGAGSLRDKIANASAGDTITFDPSLSGMTLTLGGTELLIDKDLTINASALSGGITIDANNASRVINITSSNVVTLDSLTVTGGNTTTGGGINVFQSSLTLQNSTITGNTALYGAGLYSTTNLSGVTTTLINCTITNNSASTQGGGIYNYQGKTILAHCTITANTAPAGKGSGGASYGDSFTLTEVFATIISGNTNSDVDFVFGGTNSFTSTDANLIGTGNATGAFNQPKDQVGITNPQLAPLGDYGGPTQTMPPLSGSPAIDAGGTTDPGGTDQRGFPRFVNGALDIGAVETTVPDFATLWPTDDDLDGNPYGIEYALGTDPDTFDPGHPANFTSPVFNGSGHATFTFGRNPAAEANTIWILKRSTTLLPGSFIEIFRFDGPSLTPTNQTGITSTPGPTSFSVTDTSPPADKAFYHLEIIHVP